ncbi:uncharacterized protein [Haliotis cracherodii]|uniref:uncharacterized protein n=1 Tax=Haliotis cracherodii TaxID=6455 RepID=UPI0039EA8F55
MALYEGVLYMTALNERGNIFKMPREGGLISNIPYSGSEYRFARITVFRKHGCSPGWFGRTCNLACGQCLAGSTCDQMSGYCTLGCDVGWTGRTCKAESKDGSFGSWTTSPPASQTSPWGVGCKQGWIEFTEGKPVLWTLVGGCGLLALLVCALVVVVCRCKRKLTRLRINQNKDGSCIRMDDKAYQEYLTAQDAQESNDNTYEVI